MVNADCSLYIIIFNFRKTSCQGLLTGLLKFFDGVVSLKRKSIFFFCFFLLNDSTQEIFDRAIGEALLESEK
jgi:hypothetical protein